MKRAFEYYVQCVKERRVPFMDRNGNVFEWGSKELIELIQHDIFIHRKITNNTLPGGRGHLNFLKLREEDLREMLQDMQR